tara:strand:+ start:245 stop:1324 length:1080 start_codon:yes stop_codon:yes gene_type:complete
MKLKTPNFTDPRVKRRMEKALGWVLMTMPVNRPKTLYCRDIGSSDALGASQNPVSKWLKYHLLICTNDAFSKDRGKCKEYRLNLEGVRHVAEILNYNVFCGITGNYSELGIELGVRYAQEHYDLANIEYKEKSSRYWNPIQNIRRDIRNRFLASGGLTEQYDIECCAQTLIYQTYLRLGKPPLMMIESYINERSAVRNKIAEDTGISVDIVKQLLVAMNNNSRLQAHHQCSTFHLVDYSEALVHAYNNHPAVVYLKADMTTMWRAISDRMPDRELVTTQSGIERRVRINGKSKSAMYFSLEKLVMDIAYNYLEQNSKRFFRLHDAFITEPITQQQTTDIINLIQQQTGYTIKLERSLNN